MPNSSDFNHFSVNPVNIDISRSIFNMNHSVKFSTDVGYVVPFDVMEVLPGDTFEIDTAKVVRLQPLVTPIMDEVILDTYWFFVPNRLVWNHWVNFMGENTEDAWNPTTEYKIPKIKVPSGGFNVGTIADYMGVPTGRGANFEISALPFRAYALICDQWFRSTALMDPVHCFVDDTTRTGSNGNDQVTDIELGGMPFIACKFFDYFTGCLPSPQRGPSVEFNLVKMDSTVGKTFPVESHPSNIVGYDKHPFRAGQSVIGTSADGVHMTFRDDNHTNFTNMITNHDLGIDTSSELRYKTATTSGLSSGEVYFDNLWVTMKPGTFNSVSINDLRTAFAIQKYLEKSARYGGRYIEHIKAFFNVDSPDARLQRTEYLGGSRLSLNINSVEATSSQGQPIGTVAGMSVTGDSNSDFTKSFTEDGLLIGCAVIRYHHTYQDGLDRMWLRDSTYDYYNPVFANLGEQAVYEQEIFMTPRGSDFHNDVFGYQERWAEYRTRPSRIAGEFRSRHSNTLDMWHLGDNYASWPYLNASWIREDKANLDRCLAVTSEVANQVLCDFYIQCKASRPMPLYSIPGLIDHH